MPKKIDLLITTDGKLKDFVEVEDTRILSNVPGVYGITHEATKTVYVGSSDDLGRRTSENKSDLRHGVHGNKNLQEKYNADPEVSFAYQPTNNRDEAYGLEQAILNANVASPQLLNIATDVRASGRGLVLPAWTDDRHEAHSARVKANWRDPAYRQHQESVRQTSEFKERLKASNKQVWDDPKYRQRMTDLKNTPEAKQNMSEVATSRWNNPESRAMLMESVARGGAKRRKPVEIEGKSYDSFSIAVTETGIPSSTLAKRLRSTSEKFKDYRFV